MPSDTEGLPLSIVEAMALGLPCIATRVGGVPELIDHGYNGYLITADRVDELVYSIKKLMDDRDLLVRMGHHARSKYEGTFTIDTFLRGVAGIIHAK